MSKSFYLVGQFKIFKMKVYLVFNGKSSGLYSFFTNAQFNALSALILVIVYKVFAFVMVKSLKVEVEFLAR